MNESSGLVSGSCCLLSPTEPGGLVALRGPLPGAVASEGPTMKEQGDSCTPPLPASLRPLSRVPTGGTQGVAHRRGPVATVQGREWSRRMEASAGRRGAASNGGPPPGTGNTTAVRKNRLFPICGLFPAGSLCPDTSLPGSSRRLGQTEKGWADFSRNQSVCEQDAWGHGPAERPMWRAAQRVGKSPAWPQDLHCGPGSPSTCDLGRNMHPQGVLISPSEGW